MKYLKMTLLTQQINKRISVVRHLKEVELPKEGWIFTIRNSLKMTLKQLGKRMGISPQSVKEMETREKTGAITLKTMNEIARALNMKFVYALVPEEESLQKIIEKRAFEIAKEIVERTSMTMKLENQGVSDDRIQLAIRERAEQIQKEMPRYLWD